MIYDDIVKLQKMKKEIKEDSTKEDLYQKRIVKIEKKYKQFDISEDNEPFKIICYADKHDNRVVVLKDGEVFQVKGNNIHPQFLALLYAFCSIIVIMLILTFLSLFYTQLYPFLNAMLLSINPLAIILLIFNIICCWKTIWKRKSLLVIIIIAICCNIFATILKMM